MDGTPGVVEPPVTTPTEHFAAQLSEALQLWRIRRQRRRDPGFSIRKPTDFRSSMRINCSVRRAGAAICQPRIHHSVTVDSTPRRGRQQHRLCNGYLGHAAMKPPPRTDQAFAQSMMPPPCNDRSVQVAPCRHADLYPRWPIPAVRQRGWSPAMITAVIRSSVRHYSRLITANMSGRGAPPPSLAYNAEADALAHCRVCVFMVPTPRRRPRIWSRIHYRVHRQQHCLGCLQENNAWPRSTSPPPRSPIFCHWATKDTSDWQRYDASDEDGY